MGATASRLGKSAFKDFRTMAVSTKPASGFRDFLPDEMRLRSHVFGVIRTVFEAYGFEQLDTPAMERLDTLLGKYGDEGDQLLFKVLKRGDKLAGALAGADVRDTDLADMGLRYDLTVPLARVYAQHRNQLPRIFKRFQIAPVWRADRPQKGRFREFYQCDVDIVGSRSMSVEAEVTSALAEILHKLEFGDFRIHVNHRKVLSAMMQVAEVAEQDHVAVITVLDKLDKIGRDGVRRELEEFGLAEDAITALVDELPHVDDRGARTFGELNDETLQKLQAQIGATEDGAAAIAELQTLLELARHTRAAAHLVLDAHLARGLSYYTGPIFEIRSDDFNGSLGGGGRYDELIGMFLRDSIPACGFSLGVERILVLMRERGLQQEDATAADVLVTTFDAQMLGESLALASELRAQGLRVDLYTDVDKLGKQFKYADERKIPTVVVLGPSELEEGVVAVKRLDSGAQTKVARADLAAHLRGA